MRNRASEPAGIHLNYRTLFMLAMLGLVGFGLPSVANTLSGEGERNALENDESGWRLPKTYGSQALLEACFSGAQLRGEPSDDVIRTRLEPRRQPSADVLQIADRLSRTNRQLPAPLRNSIRAIQVDSDKKLIALTFDLCEQANERTAYDRDIVNYLRAHKIPATFYAGGKWMQSHPQKTKQLIADPLFEIGNHAWSHGNLRFLGKTASLRKHVNEEILWTQAQYQLLRDELLASQCASAPGVVSGQIPTQPATFRFPYGTCDANALNTLTRYGLAAVQWNVVTADPVREQSPRAIANAILRRAKSGSIVVMHANGRGWNTSDALDLFVPKLKARGFNFVTVSAMLESGTPISSNTCYELRPGDNARYDRLFGNGTGVPRL